MGGNVGRHGMKGDSQREPEGLQAEGDEDDGGAHGDRRKQVQQRQPPAGQDDPQPHPDLGTDKGLDWFGLRLEWAKVRVGVRVRLRFKSGAGGWKSGAKLSWGA